MSIISEEQKIIDLENEISFLKNTLCEKQKKIEELKDIDKHITKETIEFVNNHYIHKDKIREKLNYFENSFDYDDDGTSYELVMKVLEELLEENTNE